MAVWKEKQPQEQKIRMKVPEYVLYYLHTVQLASCSHTAIKGLKH